MQKWSKDNNKDLDFFQKNMDDGYDLATFDIDFYTNKILNSSYSHAG